ncbi:hypothetical protein LguiA_020403 [Lonicera macranthoides]
MKVHPSLKQRNITFRYDIASSLSQSNRRKKILRRLPHIFAKVLELPFHSDADVFIEETSDSLRFIVPTDEIGDEIMAHTVEIYPGVTKIVIRGNNVFDLSIHELDLDVWRFRLPEFTSPELASAIYGDGELVVTVPKVVNLDENDGIWGENGNIGGGQLVLAQ